MGNTFAGKYSEMLIKEVGEETVNGIPCRKYEHRTQGMLAKVMRAWGHLWLAKEDPRHYTVKYTCNMMRNNKWKNFAMQLKGIKRMEEKEWEVLLQERVVEATAFWGWTEPVG
ncbi:MAG TPA: hypothetical protein VIL83_03725 [Capillibacterium sp.]